jgi:hypothetical protein
MHERVTPSVPKHLTSDFFNTNFDHSSYLKYFKNMKKSNIMWFYYIMYLKYIYLIFSYFE